jgi:hypothetical protein
MQRRRIPGWRDACACAWLLAVPIVAGCNRPPAAVESESAGPAGPVEIVAWLEDDPGGPAGLPADADMIATARADTNQAWLWVSVELDENECVRLPGPGALRLRLEWPDGTVRDVDDEGMRVPLDAGGNTFLNSASGPITIRASLAHGSSTCVPLLVRLPALARGRPAARGVAAVPERWLRH